MDTLEGKQLLNVKGNIMKAEQVLENKSIILYYFSASWSPPCKLLSLLKKIYSENVKRKCGLEVIFVSSDSSKENFEECFKKQGGWYAIPYQDPVGEELKYKYHVTTIPHVIVVKKDGTLITNSGKTEIEEIGVNVLVTWTD